MINSNSDKKRFDHQQMRRTLLYTALFNTAIAGLLIMVGFSSSFGMAWVFSQCIGLTICVCVMSASRLIQPEQLAGRVCTVIISISIGAVIGTALAALFLWLSNTDDMLAGSFWLQVVGISIVFGLIITYFFYSREQLAASADMIHAERIKRLSSEKQMLEANLKRLQAQIEPHFLFNTLSNIVSLMETDPTKAKAMQMDLIRYLRTTLRSIRNQATTLGEEFDRLRAYLDIYKIRMGERLHYDIDCPSSLVNQAIAPMLLQPLVENAVIHGLEPKIEGGRISVQAIAQDDLLRLVVADTGNGMLDNQKPGVGLSNVKARIEYLFGPQGRLHVEENRPSGLRVMIEVPRT